ncbi:NAD(P)-dependent dehydrogenase (short-subunit alcohol dehydrogenase family), partial [Leifsonia sp. 563]
MPNVRFGAAKAHINISSVHGLRASEFKSAYVTAKHALEG